MKMLTKTTVAALSGLTLTMIAAAALPSMAQAGPCSDARTDGAVIGGIAGGALGNSLSGHNRGAGTLLGALLGAAVGSEVGQSGATCPSQPRSVPYQPAGYVTRTETVYTSAPPPPTYVVQPAYVTRADWDDRDRRSEGVYPQFQDREDHIRHEIMDLAHEGAIDWDHARGLLGRLEDIQGQERREFSFHGWDLPYDDQARIDAQLDQLDRRVDWIRDNS